MIGREGIIMNKYVKWKDIKNNMTSLSEDEKTEVDLLSEIISAIVERRQELGISQRELEKMTGIKQESICRIENMKNKPQLDTNN
jgi:ribosome-binding protein aMBF1 (putative translation factor)